jgi:hypothetical protein
MQLAKEAGLNYTDAKFAHYLDERDPLKHFREQFHIPTNESLMGGMMGARLLAGQQCDCAQCPS